MVYIYTYVGVYTHEYIRFIPILSQYTIKTKIKEKNADCAAVAIAHLASTGMGMEASTKVGKIGKSQICTSNWQMLVNSTFYWLSVNPSVLFGRRKKHVNWMPAR